MDDKDKSEKRSRDRHSERHRDSDDHRPRDSDDHRHHRSDKHHKRDPKSRDRDKDRAYEREGSKDRDRDRNSVQERESRSKVKRDEEREDLVELGHSSQSHKRKERELSKERNFEDKKLRLPLRGGNEGNLGIKVKNEEQEEKVNGDDKIGSRGQCQGGSQKWIPCHVKLIVTGRRAEEREKKIRFHSHVTTELTPFMPI
ncbi:hypothetical protein LR48_Vigan03g127400 [Vigna angularis]|uniref:Uncharacterized protein n=1 Tax=Phaseolus angularis TaxID=3914 RepID=A0A0L9U5C6_PHAAN|nr:hypothetical protein LR48_Vigan03g127400 [Vigna angularis]